MGVIAIGVKLTEILATYFIEKGLDSFIGNKSNFKSKLSKAIDNTIIEYQRDFPQEDVDGKFAFYKSQKVIDELLKYRIMKDDYNLSDLENVFDDETNIIPPKKNEIEQFYNIFIKNINLDDELKGLEISETFEIEVFNISKKIDSLSHKIENILNGIHPQLKSEWERQIKIYSDSIRYFKPNTALNLLLELQKSIDTSESQPSDSIFATIEFLKAQCYDMLGNKEDSYKSYIKAYRKRSSSVIFIEKACYSYYKIGEIPQVNILIDELLKEDQYNTVAWALKILIQNTLEFEDDIQYVPPFVRNDINFCQIIFYNTIENSVLSNQLNRYKKYLKTPKISEYNNSKITIDNYKNKIFWIEYFLNEYINVLYINFSKIYKGNIELLIFIKEISTELLSVVSKSEIMDNFSTLKFFNKYADYVINESRDAVLEMRLIYPSVKNQNKITLLILANSLQLIGEESYALDIINAQEKKCIESFNLELFCHFKANNIDDYIRVSKEMIHNTKIVDNISIQYIFDILRTLCYYKKEKAITYDEIINDKEFETENLKILIEEYLNVILKIEKSETISKLESIEEYFLKEKSNLVYYIAWSYYILEEFERSILLFNKYINKEVESKDLLCYINSLDASRSHNKELLKLLEYWRENFSFNEDLLRIEADLCKQLPDWDKCVKICELFLSIYKDEESFIVLHLLALNNIADENRIVKIQSIAETLKSHKFLKNQNAKNACNIFIQNNLNEIALEILYREAFEVENKNARMDYFTYTAVMPEILFKEKEIVELGCFVKYQFNNVSHYIQILDDSQNVLAENFLGHKKGDVVTIKRPYTNKTDDYSILRIMNKYLYLFDTIVEEVNANPHSGMPLQSIEFNNQTPEGLSETLVSAFGEDGTTRKEMQEKNFDEYYNYRLSYTEIIVQNYSSDFIGGYYSLINSNKGFAQIPISIYSTYEFDDKREFVIDFTSLFMLFQLHLEQNLTYNKKFIISRFVVDYIKARLKQEKFKPKEQMFIDVTNDGVNPVVKSENSIKKDILYLENLIAWIDDNCIETISENTLDYTRRLDDKIKNTTFSKYLIDNLMLIMDSEDRILLSDDLIYFKFYSINSFKILSTELFIKLLFPDNDSLSIEFIKNKYYGYSPSPESVFCEFKKKVEKISNQYQHCLNNMSLGINPTKETIYTSVRFLKLIVKSSMLAKGELESEVYTVLLSLLKSAKEVKDFAITIQVIKEEFNEIEDFEKLILKPFSDVIKFLSNSKN